MRRRIVRHIISIGTVPLALLTLPVCAAGPAAKSVQRLEAETLCHNKPAAELARLLGDERFILRQCAEERLHELLLDTPADQPNEVEETCYRAFRDDPDPEVRMRALAVLQDFATHLWSPNGFLGLAVAPDSTFGDKGEVIARLKITKVLKDGPAARAGLRVDDVILAVDDTRFAGSRAAKQFEQYLAPKPPGAKLLVRAQRDQQKMKINVVLGHKPRGPNGQQEGRQQTAVDPAQCLREYLRSKNPASKPSASTANS